VTYRYLQKRVADVKIEFKLVDCKTFAQYYRQMKWLEEIKYKLWWRGVTLKDLAILVLMPTSILAMVVFMLYAFGQVL
jgi:hypothetical protein